MRPGDIKVTPNPSWRWLAERVWSVEHAFERIKAEGRAEEDTRVRIFFVLAAFSLAFVILAFGAARAALFSGNAHARSGPAAAAERADLVDRNGLLMAANLTHYKLFIDPEEVWEPAETRRAIRRVLPKVSADRLRKAIQGQRRAFIIGGLTPQQRQAVHDLALPGVYFEEEDKRAYPLGTSAAHLIGFVDAGGKGLAGVERALDADIRTAGRDGRPVALSIDLRVQAALEDELAGAARDQQARGAVGIVTDVRTGEILGLASYPSFDPGAAGRASDDQRLNRATQAVYEMGSTFKVFTLAAALDSGAANRNSTFDVASPLNLGGRVVHDHDAKGGRVTLEDVFIHSSNIGTSKLALSMGAPTVTRYFKALGLFAPGELELSSAWPIRPRKWDPNTLASVSFGQAISVSPVTLAQAMGAVLNGGRLVPLTIRRLEPGRAPEGQRVISEATSRNMLDLMRLNVVRGTGSKANAAGLRVGGKTGSAQKVVNGRYAQTTLVSSFAAVFPTDGPMDRDRYLVLVVLDEPHGSAASGGARTGGWTAAPAAGRIIDRIAPFLGVRRAADPFSTATGEKLAVEETPDALGEAEQ
ncbi:MAG: penicillin-binding protein 2 [Caulobacteraceae bacterium]|nr:penicillin-binding protein 2 [Caulobacteraceae bacterium]